VNHSSKLNTLSYDCLFLLFKPTHQAKNQGRFLVNYNIFFLNHVQLCFFFFFDFESLSYLFLYFVTALKATFLKHISFIKCRKKKKKTPERNFLKHNFFFFFPKLLKDQRNKKLYHNPKEVEVISLPLF
jgi:hypothetical protein